MNWLKKLFSSRSAATATAAVALGSTAPAAAPAVIRNSQTLNQKAIRHVDVKQPAQAIVERLLTEVYP